MTPDQMHRLATWLRNLDSHEIYSDEILKELLEFGIAYHKGSGTLVHQGKSVNVPVYNSEELKEQIDRRGLGGWVKQGDWRGIAGWDLANTIASLLGLRPEPKIGRGSQFRAVLEVLDKKG